LGRRKGLSGHRADCYIELGIESYGGLSPFPCVQTGRSPLVDYAYVDMTATLGYIIELTSGADFRRLFE